MRWSRGAGRLLAAGALCLLPVAGWGALRLEAVSVSTPGSGSSPPNDGGGFAAASAALVSAGETALVARLAFNANADVGGVREQTGLFILRLTFAVAADVPYRLQVETSVLAELTRVADAAGCQGSASFSGIIGESNRPLAGGALGLGGSAVLDSGATTAAREYRASGLAAIAGLPGDAPVPHVLTFTSSAAVRSGGCEIAVRGGLDNGTTLDCSACGYPGEPARAAAADGLLVRVTLVPACGDGVVDPGAGEACDLGARNGDGACCDAGCQPRPAGAACASDANPCTDDVCDGSGAECAYPFNAAPCDDGVFCNGADTCVAGACALHAGSPCAGPDGDGDCRESCDEARAACDAPDPIGNVCTADASDCTADACDGDGVCVATPRPGACDDGDPCTRDEICVAGACGAGVPVCDACQQCTDAGPGAGMCSGPPCTPPPSPTPTPGPCAGDCDGNGVVTVSELVTLVGIALDLGDGALCPRGDGDGDGRVVIGELVAAVARLLDGCP